MRAADGTMNKGNVWTFTVADFLLVDDFESYNDLNPEVPASNRILDKWVDGFGTTTNGALVGNDLPPLCRAKYRSRRFPGVTVFL